MSRCPGVKGYECVYVCMHVSLFHVCIYVYCLCMQVSAYVCMFICAAHLHLYMLLWQCLYVCVCHVFVFTYVCMYGHVCMSACVTMQVRKDLGKD